MFSLCAVLLYSYITGFVCGVCFVVVCSSSNIPFVLEEAVLRDCGIFFLVVFIYSLLSGNVSTTCGLNDNY